MKHWIDITTTDGAVVKSTVTDGSAQEVAASLQQILDEGYGALRIETGHDTWAVLRPGDIARVEVHGISEGATG